MIKRAIDLSVAAILLIVLSPMMIVIAIFSLLFLGRPIFFKQSRPGLNANIFELYKFRTMRNANAESGKPLSDDLRLTPYGKFLRSSSLDELPELWNVLRGEMSLVGPRPLLVQYLPLYSPEQARRHTVRPGITGWAQVNGRNSLSWSDKFKLDVWYVENQNLWLDLKILFMTIGQVMRRRGINSKDHATMPPFELEK